MHWPFTTCRKRIPDSAQKIVVRSVSSPFPSSVYHPTLFVPAIEAPSGSGGESGKRASGKHISASKSTPQIRRQRSVIVPDMTSTALKYGYLNEHSDEIYLRAPLHRLLEHEKTANTYFDPEEQTFVYRGEDGLMHEKRRGLTRLLKHAFWMDTPDVPKRSRAEGRTGRDVGRRFDRERTHALNCTDTQCVCGYIRPPSKMTDMLKNLFDTASERGITLHRSEVPITSMIASFSTAIDAIGLTSKGGLVLVECKTGYGSTRNTKRGDLTLPREFAHLKIKASDQSRHMLQLLAEVGVVEHEYGIPVDSAYVIYCSPITAEWIPIPEEWKELSLDLLLALGKHH